MEWIWLAVTATMVLARSPSNFDCAGRAATESSRANARDAHRQRRAEIGSGEEGQENVIADPETVNLFV